MKFWLDLETTGLDHDNDHILEIAWHLTDAQLRSIEGRGTQSAVITPFPEVWNQIAASPFIQDMHGSNGLLEDLAGKNTKLLKHVEADILDHIRFHRGVGEEVIIAGSSVYFDLLFIRRWMPDLAAELHYRIYDVTTLIQFFEPLGYVHGVPDPDKAHRAKGDVERSLAIARSYRSETLHNQHLAKKYFAAHDTYPEVQA